jgi:hypothetical protein
MSPRLLAGAMALAAVAVAIVLLFALPARAHDIYMGVTGYDGQNCCHGEDCEEAEYREARGVVEFYSTRHSAWVKVDPRDITYRSIPGARPGKGHWCGKPRDKTGTKRGIDPMFSTYCAFMPSGDS